MTVSELTHATDENFYIWSSKCEALFDSKYGTWYEYKEYRESTVKRFKIGSDGGSKFIDIFIEEQLFKVEHPLGALPWVATKY